MLEKSVLAGLGFVVVCSILVHALRDYRCTRTVRLPPAGLELFRSVVASEHFYLTSTTDTDLQSLSKLAEHTRTTAQQKLGIQLVSNSPLPVHICRHVEELFSVERRYAVPIAKLEYESKRRELNVVGGYYHTVPMIAFHGPRRRHAALVCHEVVHSVIGRVSPACPRPINEGAAMLLMEQILGEMPHLEREWNHERAMLAYACIRAVKGHIIPTLEDLFALNYWDFVQSERFYHWMSRCLVEVLLHQTNEIAFAELLTRFDDSTTGWEVFARSYSVERIERLWWERIREIARGT